MDIVSRLKQYLESRGISVTQFADSCEIPRPSASQLLNGRNKKVSDEVITKIHQSYPSLSMLWLLFGEGDMDQTANIETSEPQNGTIQPVFAPQEPENKANEMEFSFASSSHDEESEKNDGADFAPDTVSDEDPAPYLPAPGSPADLAAKAAARKQREAKSSDSFTFTTDTRKRVMSIVVYYDDNSFESFIPDPSRRTPFSR